MLHLLVLAEGGATASSNIVGIVVGSISILASIAYVVRMLTRMESKLDTHNETAKEHKAKLDEHGKTLASHESRLAVLEDRDPTERHLRAVK